MTRLQISLLNAKSKTMRSVNDFQRALQELAKGDDALDETYTTMWDFIATSEASNAELSKDALMWIAFAFERLSIVQLRYALAAQISPDKKIRQNDLAPVKSTLDSLLGLVGIDKLGYVGFIHLTAREFFPKFLRTTIPERLKLMCRACLRYIDLEYIEVSSCSTSSGTISQTSIQRLNIPSFCEIGEVEDSLKKSPFFSYAVNYWQHHANLSGDEFRHELRSIFSQRELSSRIARIDLIQRLHWPLSIPRLPSQVLPQHIAAYFGQLDFLIALIDNGAVVDAQDTNGWTALRWAVFSGRTEIICYLLDLGASVDTQDLRGETILLWALNERATESGAKPQRIETNGHLVHYQIGRRWTTNTRFPYISPIKAICSNHIMKLLVAGSKDVNIRNDHGETALLRAASNHQFDIIKELLAHGASIEHSSRSLSALMRVLTLDLPDRYLPATRFRSIGHTLIHIGDHYSQQVDDRVDVEEEIESTLRQLVGDNVNEQDQYGRSASTLAGIHGFRRLSCELLARRTLEVSKPDFPPPPPSPFEVGDLSIHGKIIAHIGLFVDHSPLQRENLHGSYPLPANESPRSDPINKISQDEVDEIDQTNDSYVSDTRRDGEAWSLFIGNSEAADETIVRSRSPFRELALDSPGYDLRRPYYGPATHQYGSAEIFDDAVGVMDGDMHVGDISLNHNMLGELSSRLIGGIGQTGCTEVHANCFLIRGNVHGTVGRYRGECLRILNLRDEYSAPLSSQRHPRALLLPSETGFDVNTPLQYGDAAHSDQAEVVSSTIYHSEGSPRSTSSID